MSFDRFLAVTKAFDSRKWLVSLRSPSASYVISAIGWIFSALLCVQLYRYSRITACNTCEYIFPEDIGTRPNEILPSIATENETITRENFSDPIILSPFDQLFKDYFYDNDLHLTGTTFLEFLDCIHNSNHSDTSDCLGDNKTNIQEPDPNLPLCR